MRPGAAALLPDSVKNKVYSSSGNVYNKAGAGVWAVCVLCTGAARNKRQAVADTYARHVTW